MKRKDILIIISIVFVICLVGVITFTTKSLNQEYPKGDIEKGEVINPSKFSIYIEDENGNWVKYNIGNGAWPGEEYEYDHAACVDKDGNPTDYQPKIERKEDGKVYVESNSSVKCDLYFRRATSEPGPGTTDPEPEPPVEQELPTCSLNLIVDSNKQKKVKITTKNATQFGIVTFSSTGDLPDGNKQYNGYETYDYNNEGLSFYGLVKNDAGENYCRMVIIPANTADPGTCNPIYGDGSGEVLDCLYQKLRVSSTCSVCEMGCTYRAAKDAGCVSTVSIDHPSSCGSIPVLNEGALMTRGATIEGCSCSISPSSTVTGYTCSYSKKEYKISDYENAQQECQKGCSGGTVCSDGYSKENYDGKDFCVRRLNFH